MSTDREKFFPFGIFFLLFPKISQNRISTKILKEEIMISRKIPKFLKISHHKFTSRKLFSHIFPKNPKTGNQVFPNIPRFSHFGKYIPFCVGIPILGKVGKPAKTKLVRAAPKLHTMENNGENLGIFGKFFPNFPKREIFFPKKLLFLTVIVENTFPG